MSKLSKEMRERIAESGRKYASAYSIASHIVESMPSMVEHSNDARDFWVGYYERYGTIDVEREKNRNGYTAQDHPMFWLGHSYAMEAMAGDTASAIMDGISEDKLRRINEILSE